MLNLQQKLVMSLKFRTVSGKYVLCRSATPAPLKELLAPLHEPALHNASCAADTIKRRLADCEQPRLGASLVVALTTMTRIAMVLQTPPGSLAPAASGSEAMAGGDWLEGLKVWVWL